MRKIKTVLLVDDDPTATFLTRSLLNRLHLAEHIFSANNGLEAIDFLRSNCTLQGTTSATCPEVIFLDINMPIMNGFEFLEAFNKFDLNPKPMVFMLTTSMHPKERAQAMQHNIKGFIQKPLRKDYLLEIIKEHFG
jgi:CheY-like chemotaxis protein